MNRFYSPDENQETYHLELKCSLKYFKWFFLSSSLIWLQQKKRVSCEIYTVK